MLGVTRILQSDDLPAGINALASADSKTIIVRAGLDKVSRRSAIRQVLAATHRFPALVMYPALVDARIRRFLIDAADFVSGFLQHAAGFLTPDSPIAAILTSAAVIAAGAGVTIGVATGTISVPSFGSSATRGTLPPDPAASPRKILDPMPVIPDSYLGVYEAGTPGSYAPVTAFGHLVQHAPNLVLYYSGWGEPFKASFAEDAYDNNATPVIQIDPDKISLAEIAEGAGGSYSYLTAYAQAVHAYGQKVVIGFGHEMNARMNPWGYGKSTPQDFKAAWQYIVNLFRAQGDYNVTWLWTINIDAPGTSPIDEWWPGSQYVNWVGIDGYYFNQSALFPAVFGPTITDASSFDGGKPILISETGASPGPHEAAQIASLFRGIRQQQIQGFIWYDAVGRSGRDWRLEGDKPAITAFRNAAAHYR